MRNDKLLVDREHLLMALANVDFILIRATNTEGTLDAGYVLGVVFILRKGVLRLFLTTHPPT